MWKHLSVHFSFSNKNQITSLMTAKMFRIYKQYVDAKTNVTTGLYKRIGSLHLKQHPKIVKLRSIVHIIGIMKALVKKIRKE